jgi:AraC family transcriptional regulator of adaptative response / DNA-3-methyladenine glycosylase II
VLGALLQAVRQMLDLDADPSRIDPVLALLPGPHAAGLRLPGTVDGFEAGGARHPGPAGHGQGRAAR